MININEILKNINNNLNYIKFNLKNDSINQFVIDCIANNFKKCNDTFLKINDNLQTDLIANSTPSLLLLDDVVELNKQLGQLCKTCQYFFGERCQEIVAIKQLKKDTSLLKATIKTLGFSGEMLEDEEA